MSAFVVKYIIVSLCGKLLECIIFVKSQKSRTEPLKLMVSAEVPFVAVLYFLTFTSLGKHLLFPFTPDVCLSFPPRRVVPDSIRVPHPPKLRLHLSIWLSVGWLEVRDEAPLVSYSSWCNREQPGSKLPSSGIIPAHAINEVIVLDYKICIFKT